jgi:hypothetical protein
VYSAIVLFLVAAAAVFSWLLIYGKVPQAAAAWIQTGQDPVSSAHHQRDPAGDRTVIDGIRA